MFGWVSDTCLVFSKRQPQYWIRVYLAFVSPANRMCKPYIRETHVSGEVFYRRLTNARKMYCRNVS